MSNIQTEQINLPDDFLARPWIHQCNYQFRAATMADLENVVALCNLYDEVHGGPQLYSVERMGANWIAPGFDLAHATRVVLAPNNEIVGFAIVHDMADPPVKPQIHFCVHPNITDENVSTQLLHWADTRSRHCLTRVAPDIRVKVHAKSLSTFSQRKKQLEQAGFYVLRHSLDMQIPLDTQPPEPIWPHHITPHFYETTEEVIANLPEIITAVEEAFQDHFGHVERPMNIVINEWIHRLKHDSDFDPRLWFIARDGADIAGNVLCWPRSWPDKDEGYIGVLSVRRPWRRQGLGLALLHHAFANLYRLGKPKAGLSVDAGSLTGAVDLYKKAGMHVVRQYDIYEKELRPGRDITATSLS